MPRFDRTGPQGQGPMTGKGMGPCCKGRRFGRGMGRYFGWNAPQKKDEKIEDLEAYKKALQEEIEDVEKDLANVKKEE